MAHYSVIVTVEDGRLVARATRDFLHPVPAAALAVADGDEVSWFCESGELRIIFEASPFRSGAGQLTAPPGRPTAPESVAPAAAGQRQVFSYGVRLTGKAGRPLEGSAYVIVETPAAASRSSQAAEGADRPQRTNSITRDGEFLDRAPGEVRMSVHKLIIKAAGSGKVDYGYYFNGTHVQTFNLIKYIIAKKGDEIQFEVPSGQAVVTFGRDGTPLQYDESVVAIPDPTVVSKYIEAPADPGFFGFKFSVVLFDGGVAVDDPHIIINNTD